MKKFFFLFFMLLSVSAFSQTLVLTIQDTNVSSQKWQYTWNGTAEFHIVLDSSGVIDDTLSYIECTLSKTRIVYFDTICKLEVYRVPLAGQIKAKAFIESNTMRSALKRQVNQYGFARRLTEY